MNGYLNRGIKVSRHRVFNASMHRGAQACRTRLSADTGVGQQAPSSLTPSVPSSHHCIDFSTNECVHIQSSQWIPVSRYRGIKPSWFQCINASRHAGMPRTHNKVSRQLGSKASRHLGLNVSRHQGVKASWFECINASWIECINASYLNASMHRGVQAWRTRLGADTGVGQQAPSSLTPSVPSYHHCIDFSTNECGRTERRTTKSARSDAARTKTIENFWSLQETCCENVMKFIRPRLPSSLISKGGRLPDFPKRQSRMRCVREHRNKH